MPIYFGSNFAREPFQFDSVGNDWEQDMAYFKDAHINSATINVFSWAKIQPSENEYNFTEIGRAHV